MSRSQYKSTIRTYEITDNNQGRQNIDNLLGIESGFLGSSIADTDKQKYTDNDANTCQFKSLSPQFKARIHESKNKEAKRDII